MIVYLHKKVLHKSVFDIKTFGDEFFEKVKQSNAMRNPGRIVFSPMVALLYKTNLYGTPYHHRGVITTKATKAAALVDF